jgi:hypothetical protein
MAVVRWSENWRRVITDAYGGASPDRPDVVEALGSAQLQDYLIAVGAAARIVASLIATAIANAINPYSIGVAALSSRVKRSSVSLMASLSSEAPRLIQVELKISKLRRVPARTMNDRFCISIDF